MEKLLLDFLGGRRETDRSGYTLRVVTARELLEAREEAGAMDPDSGAEGLCAGACVLARAVIRGGKRVFYSGKAVMEAWSVERIAEELTAYRALADRVDPDCRKQEKMEAIMAALKREPMERIRWRVLRAFSALPTEQRVREMTEGDYLYCAAQLLLDRQETLEKLCPSCRSRAEQKRCPGCGRPVEQESGGNPQFDARRFEELKARG